MSMPLSLFDGIELEDLAGPAEPAPTSAPPEPAPEPPLALFAGLPEPAPEVPPVPPAPVPPPPAAPEPKRQQVKTPAADLRTVPRDPRLLPLDPELEPLDRSLLPPVIAPGDTWRDALRKMEEDAQRARRSRLCPICSAALTPASELLQCRRQGCEYTCSELSAAERSRKIFEDARRDRLG